MDGYYACMHAWMDGWMDVCMDVYIYIYTLMGGGFNPCISSIIWIIPNSADKKKCIWEATVRWVCLWCVWTCWIPPKFGYFKWNCNIITTFFFRGIPFSNNPKSSVVKNVEKPGRLSPLPGPRCSSLLMPLLRSSSRSRNTASASLTFKPCAENLKQNKEKHWEYTDNWYDIHMNIYIYT